MRRLLIAFTSGLTIRQPERVRDTSSTVYARQDGPRNPRALENALEGKELYEDELQQLIRWRCEG